MSNRLNSLNKLSKFISYHVVSYYYYISVLLVLCSASNLIADDDLKFKLEKQVLSNGLTVYYHEDNETPSMSFYILYDVGSVNEKLGITGISHLFEHMMFNGSSKYKPKEFDRFLETAGGYSNGYTTNDFTAYMESFPPSALDLVLDLESDRMASLSITESNLEQERGIVKEERRLRTDNDPFGKLEELLFLLAYTSHPYRNPVVGYMSDLNNIKRDDTQNYFNTYYTPNNAIVVMCGNFKTDVVKNKMEQYFGKIKKGPEIKPPYGVEPPQEGERRGEIVQDAELASFLVGWHVPGTDNEKDVAALDVLQLILSNGESSRLQQKMVREKEVAVDVSAWNYTMKGPSLFYANVQVAPSKQPQMAEAVLYEEINSLIGSQVSQKELQKAKNILKTQTLREFETNNERANLLGVHAVQYGDPLALTRMMSLRDKVGPEDIQRVVKKYFSKENRTVVTIIPKPKS